MQIKRTREENVAKYGTNCEKEAEGLGLVRAAVNADGRMCFQKCAEGARADFCVHAPGATHRAMGVQLKTTHTLCYNSGGSRHARFRHTEGYAGLLLLLIDFSQNPPRAWVIPGDQVTTEQIAIVIEPKRPSGRTTHDFAAAEVAGVLHATLQKFDKLFSVDALILPTSATKKREYRAHQWLQRHLLLDFDDPAAEQCAWDYTVAGTKWQAKVASYCDKTDCFLVGLRKNSGKRDGKYTWQQYEAHDFDYLAVQLPINHHRLVACPPHMYLIPMATLVKHGAAGCGKRSSNIRFYPHRRGGFGHWTSEFLLDLRDPDTALSEYVRLTSE